MYSFLMTIHVTACVLMILVVLLQAGRGAGLSVFGGGGGDQLFNTPTTTGFMKQLTSGLAITFGITSLLLTLLGGRVGMRSVTSAPMPVPQAAQGSAPPAAPATAPGGAAPSGTPASPASAAPALPPKR